ncbi:hypothetical protein [Azospirillum sp.]|uniref:hypothetical protein n=1 Tax=Azospirillum sp. TaxID=34012 RepID=UPI003D7254F9
MHVTKHASRRLQQRGVPGPRLERHIEFADRVVPVGDGSVCLTVSREGLAELVAAGVNRQELERLRRLAVVIAADGAVRTVMHLQPAAVVGTAVLARGAVPVPVAPIAPVLASSAAVRKDLRHEQRHP